MVQAIRVHATGGPEVLRLEEVEVGEPGPGEIRIRHSAIGLNFIDVYFRTGLYQAPALPFTPGMEAAGVVEAAGEGVTDLCVGDRVAYAAPPLGAYAQARLFPADRAVRLPDGIDDRTAAAAMLKGMTVQYLLRRTCRVDAGDTILVHAAAGGVGLLACRWARHLGATVLGTVSTDAKARLAAENGCTHPIVTRRENFVDRVREITNGRGVRVVYDSIGRDTFEGSLDCLAPLGMMVSFGQSSGPIPPFEVATLGAKGSLFLTRPSLMAYTASREDLLATARELFDLLARGILSVTVGRTWPLAQAAAAHRALEGRETTGSTILLP